MEVQISGKALIDYVQRHYTLLRRATVVTLLARKTKLDRVKEDGDHKGTKGGEQKQFVFRLRRCNIHVGMCVIHKLCKIFPSFVFLLFRKMASGLQILKNSSRFFFFSCPGVYFSLPGVSPPSSGGVDGRL